MIKTVDYRKFINRVSVYKCKTEFFLLPTIILHKVNKELLISFRIEDKKNPKNQWSISIAWLNLRLYIRLP